MSATPVLIPPVVDPQAPQPPAEPGRFEILKPKQPGYLGVEFRMRGTDRLFRLRPVRCPDQPRFWCFEVRRCRLRDEIDPTEPPWLGADRLGREELRAAVETIQADIDGWLAGPGQRSMREWIVGEEPEAA
jgi:hypothetical protein